MSPNGEGEVRDGGEGGGEGMGRAEGDGDVDGKGCEQRKRQRGVDRGWAEGGEVREVGLAGQDETRGQL